MNVAFQTQHSSTERRATPRSDSMVHCPNCSSPHVEQGEPIECGQLSSVWDNTKPIYAVYVYSCQACGADFVIRTTEHYHRQHLH